MLLLFYKTITMTLWFPCLDGLIQTLGNVVRVKKSVQNYSSLARVACLGHAFQTRKTLYSIPWAIYLVD